MSSMSRVLLALFAFAATGTAAAPAQAAGVRLAPVGRFESPVYVTAPPKDKRRLFVVEQAGTIRVVRDGKRLRTPFLDIRSRVVSGGEQGLLSMAFAPDYATSGRFYVYYTRKSDTAETIIEFRRQSADRARVSSARTLIVQPDNESNHNGGQLQFGPDGLLYAGLGDGGGGNDQHGARGNAQNLGTLLGKLIRIDPRAKAGSLYSVPADNPFIDRNGARPELYSYGLRNPFRFSFDRSTGDLTIGDVGQDQIEEINFMARGTARGANFGWRPFEGTRKNFDEPAPNAVAPVLELKHSDGFCSVTGGYVVRDPALSALKGRYVYGDFCEGHLRSVRLKTGGASGDGPVRGLAKVGSISSFGEDARGRVYVVSLDGPVYRLASK